MAANDLRSINAAGPSAGGVFYEVHSGSAARPDPAALRLPLLIFRSDASVVPVRNMPLTLASFS